MWKTFKWALLPVQFFHTVFFILSINLCMDLPTPQSTHPRNVRGSSFILCETKRNPGCLYWVRSLSIKWDQTELDQIDWVQIEIISFYNIWSVIRYVQFFLMESSAQQHYNNHNNNNIYSVLQRVKQKKVLIVIRKSILSIAYNSFYYTQWDVSYCWTFHNHTF